MKTSVVILVTLALALAAVGSVFLWEGLGGDAGGEAGAWTGAGLLLASVVAAAAGMQRQDDAAEQAEALLRELARALNLARMEGAQMELHNKRLSRELRNYKTLN